MASAALVNGTPPSITGTPQQAQILTLHQGTWTDPPLPSSAITITDQWETCIDVTCTISDQTGPTYTVAPGDVGRTIKVLETATTLTDGPEKATSVPTATVIALPPLNAVRPAITGTAQVGKVLTLTAGQWSNSPTLTEQWEACTGATCSPISGQTGPTYTVAPGDIGRTIEVLETATNTGGATSASSSPTLLIVAPSATSLIALPSSPTTNQTVTLVATVSSTSGTPNPSGSLTFYDGASTINGCVNKSFNTTGPIANVTCQTSFPTGAARLAALYTPRAGLLMAGSASPVIMLNVGRDSTSTSLAVTKQVKRGDRARYTATVVLPQSNSGPIQPSGSIAFLDGGRPIHGCESRAMTKLAASCAVKYSSLGTHNISARYIGDPNFASSTSPSRSVRVVKASSAPIVLGFISSTLQWVFNYHKAYTQVTMLRADRVVKGTTIALTCAGGGCPFNRLSIHPHTGRPINLLPVFHGRHLRIGSQITLRIVRPQWIGKYYSFTVRAGRGPLILLSCLGVGRRSRPGVGC